MRERPATASMVDMASPLVPLDIPTDLPGPHHGFGGGGGPMIFPFVGTFFLLLLLATLAAVLLHLYRSGRLTGLTRLVRPAPEEEAKRVLADRFARGDIDSEDFLERASMLNWTPGSDPHPVQRRRRLRG